MPRSCVLRAQKSIINKKNYPEYSPKVLTGHAGTERCILSVYFFYNRNNPLYGLSELLVLLKPAQTLQTLSANIIPDGCGAHQRMAAHGCFLKHPALVVGILINIVTERTNR